MEHKLEVVLSYLSQHPDQIYVWVYVGEVDGVKTNHSIKVNYQEAINWCRGVAKDNGGLIPAFFTSGTVFLGKHISL